MKETIKWIIALPFIFVAGHCLKIIKALTGETVVLKEIEKDNKGL